MKIRWFPASLLASLVTTLCFSGAGLVEAGSSKTCKLMFLIVNQTKKKITVTKVKFKFKGKSYESKSQALLCSKGDCSSSGLKAQPSTVSVSYQKGLRYITKKEYKDCRNKRIRWKVWYKFEGSNKTRSRETGNGRTGSSFRKRMDFWTAPKN